MGKYSNPAAPRRASPRSGYNPTVMNEDPDRLRALLEALRLEHRDLDEAIARLAHDPHMDRLTLQRMKKRKLRLKDSIQRLESALIPDLDA